MQHMKQNDIVQTLATYTSNQPLAMRVGRRHTNRRSQYVDAPTGPMPRSLDGDYIHVSDLAEAHIFTVEHLLEGGKFDG